MHDLPLGAWRVGIPERLGDPHETNQSEVKWGNDELCRNRFEPHTILA